MTFAETTNRNYARTHQLLFGLLERVTEAQFIWRPSPLAHNIAYEVWHLSRWADHLQARLPQMTEELSRCLAPRAEIWLAEDLAAQWGFPAALELGHDQTGMGVADITAARLPMPARHVLVNYARRAFAAADEAVGKIPEDQYLQVNRENPEETVYEVVLEHMAHEARHLGMIEALLGLQGVRGTATA